MTALTPAAALATKIAAHEALMAKAGMLEKEHLFIGILSLDKVMKKEEGEEATSATSGLAKEHAAVFCLLRITGHDATVLRRLMRQALGSGDRGHEEHAIHRSPACKQIFARAAVLAAGKPVNCINLFSAIMEKPGTVISDVLAEARKCRAALRETDVLLPGPSVPVTSRSCAGTFDLHKELTAGIAETRGLLEILPAQSGEYPLVRRTLVRQLISLAILNLDTGDRASLISALQDLSGITGIPGDVPSTTCADIVSVVESRDELGREERDRIRIQLLNLEERIAGGPGA